MFCSTHYESPIGRLTLASDGEAIIGLWMEGQKYFGASVAETLTPNPDLPLFGVASKWLDAYFAGQRPEIGNLPLAPRGSDFRRAVWDILCTIPYGEVMAYGSIAQKIAAQTGRRSMSSQAVGGAVGHNPIAILIPCHRVIGSSGSLTGFSGGLAKKTKLLELEGVRTDALVALG